MSDIPSGALDAGASRAVSLLARVILPRPGEPLDVRKLYIAESDTNARRAHAPDRTRLEIGAESEVSFATYFNAFPASYWRRYSVLKSVVLRVEVSGHCRIDVYRSKADASRIHVEGREAVDGDAAQEKADKVAERLDLIADEFERGWKGAPDGEGGYTFERELRGVTERHPLPRDLLLSADAKKIQAGMNELADAFKKPAEWRRKDLRVRVTGPNSLLKAARMAGEKGV